MKVIIAGGRDICDPDILERVIADANFEITEVVCGGAKGVDTLGRYWAEWSGVPVKMFPADWGRHGKPAGFIRNGEMAKYGDALIAIWDGTSRGTRHMISAAKTNGLKIYVAHVIKNNGRWILVDHNYLNHLD